MPRFTEARMEENFPGSDLAADEVEFLLAMERYKREKHRPFPTWHEVLRVLKGLGYRKVDHETERQRRQTGTEKSETE